METNSHHRMNCPIQKSFIFLVTLVVVSQTLLWSQEIKPERPESKVLYSDTLATANTSDSVVVAPAEKSGQAEKASSVGLDTTLHYEAKLIDVLVKERITYLLGDAVVKYKNMKLTAEKITVDWNQQTLIAEGVPDTSHTSNPGSNDSTGTIKYKGTPTFSEGGDVMTGFKMLYNYKTEKGRVLQGRTEFEGGRYLGQSIKKVSQDILNVSNGSYTTCDLPDEPHFHFQSRRMKIILKDKVIAKPIILYIGKIPVAALPFGIFPHQQGRHSGVIPPRYGESAQEGRYLRELGYYWAPNDYFDARAMIDYFDRSGWLFRSDINYALRYVLRGSLSGSLTRKNFISGISQRRWDLRIQHSHTIDPTMSLNVSGTFVSDGSFYRNLSSNLDQRLTRQLYSNATLNKSWGSKTGMSINLSHTKDLETGDVTVTLPQMSFYMGQGQFFKPKKVTTRLSKRKSKEEDDAEAKWYHSLYYSYNSGLINMITQRGTREGLTRRIDHNVNLNMSSPQKFFGWLNLNQSLNYREQWYDRYKKFSLDTGTNSIKTDTVKAFVARRTFSYNASATTKLYGYFTPHIGRIKALRHIVTPSITFSYQPDFSDPKWGYYVEIADTTGKIDKRDRFLESTPRGAHKSLSWSLANLFQMKTSAGEKEKKFDLFTLDFGSGYNFEAEKFKFSSLQSSLRANPSRNLSVNLNATHSFYQFDPEQGKPVNKLLLMNKGFLRLTNFRFNAGLRLEGRPKGGKAESRGKEPGLEAAGIEQIEPGQIPDSEEESIPEYYEQEPDRFEPEMSFTGLNIPWSASLTFNFDLDKSDPRYPRKRYYVDLSGMKVQLTKNWEIQYRAHYDLKQKQLVSHSFTFRRDLHCWEAMFRWVPSGIGKEFYLRINIKAPQLRDIKIEKRGGRASVLGY